MAGRAGSGARLVHNRPTRAALVVHSGGGDDAIELSDLRAGLRGRRGAGGLVNDDEEEETYVLHEVQPHHTLQGIALQYRLTVRQPNNKQ